MRSDPTTRALEFEPTGDEPITGRDRRRDSLPAPGRVRPAVPRRRRSAVAEPATSPTPRPRLRSRRRRPPPGPLAQIAALRDRWPRTPTTPTTLRDLGLALLQRVRETADPSLYDQAEEALDRACRLAPDDPLVLVGIGGLQLGRHEFADALETAETALELAPSLAPAHAIERRRARRARPLRRGDRGGPGAARDAGRPHVARPGLVPAGAPRQPRRRGRGDATGGRRTGPRRRRTRPTSRRCSATCSSTRGSPTRLPPRTSRPSRSCPTTPRRSRGIGRLAVGRGDLDEATRQFERAAAILPLPEYVIALGEAREAAGDPAAAMLSYDLARAETAAVRSGRRRCRPRACPVRGGSRRPVDGARACRGSLRDAPDSAHGRRPGVGFPPRGSR